MNVYNKDAASEDQSYNCKQKMAYHSENGLESIFFTKSCILRPKTKLIKTQMITNK